MTRGRRGRAEGTPDDDGTWKNASTHQITERSLLVFHHQSSRQTAGAEKRRELGLKYLKVR